MIVVGSPSFWNRTSYATAMVFVFNGIKHTAAVVRTIENLLNANRVLVRWNIVSL